MNKIEKAVLFATVVHMEQKDKGGNTFILHPLAVMLKVQNELATHPDKLPAGILLEDILSAAVLHDVVEDTQTTLEEIEKSFGTVVKDLVDSVSRRKNERYFDFVRRTKQSAGGTIIKIADLHHNMSPIRMAGLPPEAQGIMNRYRKAEQILNDIVA